MLVQKLIFILSLSQCIVSARRPLLTPGPGDGVAVGGHGRQGREEVRRGGNAALEHLRQARLAGAPVAVGRAPKITIVIIIITTTT